MPAEAVSESHSPNTRPADQAGEDAVSAVTSSVATRTLTPNSSRSYRQSTNRSWMRILAMLPFLLFALTFAAYPLGQVIRMSLSSGVLTSQGFNWSWIGLANFATELQARDAWRSLLNTGIFIILTVAGSLLLGLGLALLVDRAVLMLPLARNVLVWPAVIAPVVVSLLWLLILSPTAGGLNKVLSSLGLPNQGFLNTGPGAMGSVVVVDIWHWTPVVFLFLYTALKGIDDSTLEAARVDGASEAKILRFIQLPLLRPAITAVIGVRVIMGVKVFDEMYLLTGGGPNGATTLVSQRIKVLFFDNLQFGGAAAYSIIVVALTLLVLALYGVVRLFTRGRP